jgi:hypothetical protein
MTPAAFQPVGICKIPKLCPVWQFGTAVGQVSDRPAPVGAAVRDPTRAARNAVEDKGDFNPCR